MSMSCVDFFYFFCRKLHGFEQDMGNKSKIIIDVTGNITKDCRGSFLNELQMLDERLLIWFNHMLQHGETAAW